MMAVNIDIRVKKANKIYYEGDIIEGWVVVESANEIRHDGITLIAEGVVNLQLSSKSVGIFEAFYNTVKPQILCSAVMELGSPGGKLPAGRTDIPFEVPLQARSAQHHLYETYHGVYINIQYTLRCDFKRPLLNRTITKVAEFIVEYNGPRENQITAKPVNICLTPDSVRPVGVGPMPKFRVIGKINSVCCDITSPLTGHLCIEESDLPIKSVELQLVRVETCGCAEGYSRDVTEIQNIQIGEGNVCLGMDIPIYMIFPRLFTAPSLSTSNFNIGFEVNVIVVFDNDHLVSENFPVTLVRKLPTK